jgi:hypothetical protein
MLRRSDRPIVPTKRPNKNGTNAARTHGRPYTGAKVERPETAKGRPTGTKSATGPKAEAVEERGLAKGNTSQLNALRTYGFRPGRGPHDALNALAVGLGRLKVNWLLDADIRSSTPSTTCG